MSNEENKTEIIKLCIVNAKSLCMTRDFKICSWVVQSLFLVPDPRLMEKSTGILKDQ